MSTRICSSGICFSDLLYSVSSDGYLSLSIAFFDHGIRVDYEITVVINMSEGYRRKVLKRRAAETPLKKAFTATRDLVGHQLSEMRSPPFPMSGPLFSML